MSKAKMSWVTGERPASSSKQNQQTIDHITPGLPIWSFHVSWKTGPGTTGSWGPGRLGFYPYSAAKSVFDRLWIMGLATDGSADITDDFELSFDSGSTWTGAFPSLSASTTPTFLAGSLTEIWDLDAQVGGSVYLGVRHNGPFSLVDNTTNHLHFMGFLYRSSDTPF